MENAAVSALLRRKLQENLTASGGVLFGGARRKMSAAMRMHVGARKSGAPKKRAAAPKKPAKKALTPAKAEMKAEKAIVKSAIALDKAAATGKKRDITSALKKEKTAEKAAIELLVAEKKQMGMPAREAKYEAKVEGPIAAANEIAKLVHDPNVALFKHDRPMYPGAPASGAELNLSPAGVRRLVGEGLLRKRRAKRGGVLFSGGDFSGGRGADFSGGLRRLQSHRMMLGAGADYSGGRKKKRALKGGAKGVSLWVEYVKDFAAKHGMSYKDALTAARPSYHNVVAPAL